MKKLFFAAVGATVTLLSASPAFAQSVDADMATALLGRARIELNLSALAHQAALAGAAAQSEAVLGESSSVDLGIAAPTSLKIDLLNALRIDAQRSRDMGGLTAGGSTD